MLQEKENRWATTVRRKTEEQMWVLRLLLLSDTLDIYLRNRIKKCVEQILNKIRIVRKDE